MFNKVGTWIVETGGRYPALVPLQDKIQWEGEELTIPCDVWKLGKKLKFLAVARTENANEEEREEKTLYEVPTKS